MNPLCMACLYVTLGEIYTETERVRERKKRNVKLVNVYIMYDTCLFNQWMKKNIIFLSVFIWALNFGFCSISFRWLGATSDSVTVRWCEAAMVKTTQIANLSLHLHIVNDRVNAAFSFVEPVLVYWMCVCVRLCVCECMRTIYRVTSSEWNGVWMCILGMVYCMRVNIDNPLGYAYTMLMTQWMFTYFIYSYENSALLGNLWWPSIDCYWTNWIHTTLILFVGRGGVHQSSVYLILIDFILILCDDVEPKIS